MLAYVRYQSGVDTSQFLTEEQLAAEQAQYYDQSGNYIQPQDQQSFQDPNNMYNNSSQYQSGSYSNYDADINMNQ